MIDDKLVITEYHRNAAEKAMNILEKKLETAGGPLAVTVAGESGCGKSEVGQCLKELVEKSNRKTFLFGQDDYFELPPKTNHRKREEDIEWVGTNEVKLDLLDQHIQHLKINPEKPLEKPLVYFNDDRIGSETVTPGKVDVIIAEGTYTSLLKNADMRVFINRNYKQTKLARLKRDRDPVNDFIEKVLIIEHKEISKHKSMADVIIDPPEEEKEM